MDVCVYVGIGLCKIVRNVHIRGALDGGGGRGGGEGRVPMSHVEFKKWKCRMSLSLINPYVPCLIQEMAMSHVTINFPPPVVLLRPHVACRI